MRQISKAAIASTAKADVYEYYMKVFIVFFMDTTESANKVIYTPSKFLNAIDWTENVLNKNMY